ncbi:MAG: hypothetical protein EHM61_02415 [Acidobacteria bacterium]|nr:MAG: hypothetical protein EHM61_02415 [Acidobacteriota bacterium]
MLLLLTWLLCSTGLAGQTEEDIDFNSVRANPVLRQALSSNSPYAATTDEASIEFKFRENWVDSQVDHFVKQVHQRLSDLKGSVQNAVTASSGLLADTPQKKAEATVALRQALAKAEDQSRGLRTSLSMILVELQMKDKFDVRVGQGAQAGGFETEMKLLSEQTANAEKSIRDYFFKPTHVTSIADLKDANMLDYLKRVERIARTIRGKL